MCGGIVYNLERVPEKELNKFYSQKEIENFKKRGYIASFFWDKNPILPAEKDGKISLFEWGNRDKKNELPQTGWAKEESLEKGRWNWLKPEKVNIPAEKGYEKKVWFDIDGGIEGIIVKKNKDEKIYMVTKEADNKYLKETKHDRMPIGKLSNFNKIKRKEKK